MKKFILLSSILLIVAYASGQGCVAIRNVGGISPDLLFKKIQSKDNWLLNVSNRYFEASNTYRNDKFITDTLVRNKLYTVNISVMRILQNGWSVSVIIPISANSRKNYLDHGGLQWPKHTTRAFGLGDVRFSVGKWLLNPVVSKRANVQLGLGVKFPTGDYKYADYFYRNDTTTVLAPVDQAIQLGDGGTGITTEVNAFYSLSHSLHLFAAGYYLINPREQNGVSNLKGRNATPQEIANNTTVMSVPDQYTFRGGMSFELKRIVLTAALRFEKVPVKDLVGGSQGFRRAASITSLEPGITYKMENALAFGYLGIPVQRKIVENAENNMTPAGFAKYLFYFGVQLEL